LALLLVVAAAMIAGAQQGSTDQSATSPSGDVLFSKSGDSETVQANGELRDPESIGKQDPLNVMPEERRAITFLFYDLDAHLKPADSSIAMRAVVTVRNDGNVPLGRVMLQISSTLRWEAVSTGGRRLETVSRLVDTDLDHTGAMNEAIVTLPAPLEPGAQVQLTGLYSGTVARSAERLERSGAPAAEAYATDWDEIASTGTFLRGFGHVFWYPVSGEPMSFNQGERAFDEIGRARRQNSSSMVRLRLALEYQGEPPDAAFFAGRREPLKAISDNADAPVAEAPGVATASFPAAPLGFRTLDLFVTANPPAAAGPDGSLVSAVTENGPAVSAYSAAATKVEGVLAQWYGGHGDRELWLIDHPGQPYEDETLVVRSLAADSPARVSEELAHSLTHVWAHSTHPWIEEGLAEFSRLLWLERSAGRAEALKALQQAGKVIAGRETSHGSSLDPGGAPSSSSLSSSVSGEISPLALHGGEPLADSSDEVFYRTKAAAVWWMLRGIAGDAALKAALTAYAHDAAADKDPKAIELELEKSSHKDLRWFFEDWVYEDHGLPRLSIANVATSELKGRTGLPDGWLIAVEVRNDGDAAVEVPITISSVGSTQMERLRIAARSSASTRIVFAGTPEQVTVNDGSVPEADQSTHVRRLALAR